MLSQIAISIQDAVDRGESHEDIAKGLMERYGFGKASALEFIELVVSEEND